MKYITKYLAALCLLWLCAACAFDNYDGPQTKLKGRIVYNGEPLGVEVNQVRIQLIESGYDFKTPIDVAISPEGTFSALLFNGNYKMVIPKGQGPFLSTTNEVTQSDTIPLTLRGSVDMDIEVMPYYTIENTSFSVNGTQIITSFGLEKIIAGVNEKSIEFAALYINKSQFVSRGMNIASVGIAGGDIEDIADLDLSVNIPGMVPSQNYVYARVGLKIAGVEDMLYSPVQKLQF